MPLSECMTFIIPAIKHPLDTLEYEALLYLILVISFAYLDFLLAYETKLNMNSIQTHRF